MKELKILIVLVVFTLITYIGIEPFAHSQMNPHVAPANFNYEQEDIDLANVRIKEAEEILANTQNKLSKLEEAQKRADDKKRLEEDINKQKKALESAEKDFSIAKDRLALYEELWGNVKEIKALQGDAEAGGETFTLACASCHGLKSQGIEPPFDDAIASESYGIVVPDLSSAGAIYDKNFLAALIINPAHALKLDHKFNDESPFPMTQFFGFGEDLNQEVADIIAYLASIAPKDVSGKEVFESACLRCHDLKYDKLPRPTEQTALEGYMGSNPPDLSMIIRARSAEYLETFINDPQKNIPGTSMPRVGLNQESQDKLISYLEQTGDSKKSERTTLGYFLIGFFIILAIFAYLWKNEVWKELH
ncbi:MAG: c-type cytochrome [Campylobacteraceae bacterium]|jgi:ubiquinol-cytochrome c reductase cytochrome c1 subunit|nr:c-type cytochrome [Campylobacteraceae bacterium]